MLAEDVSFQPHSDKQDRLIFSDADLTIGATGTQWGKSQAASLWLKRQIHTFTDRTDNFLILAPTYKIMNQSALPYFLYCMEGYGRYQKVDGEFKLHAGGTVYLRTGTDPDSVVGIPKVRAFWLDEAGKATLYFWENIQARAAAVGARGLLTTSPYSRNWIYQDFIRPIQKGQLKDVPLVKAASWENPFHTLHDPDKRNAMRAQMDPRRFDMIFGGEWGQMQGLVYDCWDDDENLIEPFKLPDRTQYFGQIDWGYYPDPFVLKIRAITPDGAHFGISEFVKTQLPISDIITVAKQKQKTFSISVFYADPSQPGYIEEFNRNGLPCVGADNDIRRGIDLHYELIKTRRYKEFRGACPHSADERETYHYPEPKDLGPDDNSKELKPVDQNNHCLDADRYGSIMTYRTGEKRAPKAPGDTAKVETYEQRMRRLTRIKGHGHTEEFS